MTAEDIESLIAAHLVCELCRVEGDGRHWYATIVSTAFEGMRPIARHQKVYATLGTRMKTDGAARSSSSASSSRSPWARSRPPWSPPRLKACVPLRATSASMPPWVRA